MKNIEEEEPKEYIERNMALVFVVLIIGLAIDWLSVSLLIDVNPWGTMLAIPGIVFTLQGLWLLVNPYAVIYDNRFEIKQSLIYDREFYYLDAKAIDIKKNTRFEMTYNDGDPQSLPLFGIKEAHKKASISTKPAKLSDKYAGKLSKEVGQELQKHVAQSRNEWERT